MFGENILQKLVEKLIEYTWQRDELRPLRDPIETTLQAAEFKKLTREAFETFYGRYTEQIPDFLAEDFITQGPVQEQLARYIVEGRDADLDELLRRYRDYVGANTATARPALTAYLGQVRESFAAHPTYGPILLARDVQGMFAALLSFREETRENFAKLSAQISGFLDELRGNSTIQKALERIPDAIQHIFISYTRTDIKFALKLKHDLEAQGHQVWIDTTDIKEGEEWIEAITDGINNCHAMLSLVSETANQSKWVRREFLFAEKKNKLIIPVQVEACDLPIYMMDIHAVSGVGANYATLLTRLSEQLPKSVQSPEDAIVATLENTVRQAEETYLDRLWLKHKIWLETYTPMAGVGEITIELDEIPLEASNADIDTLFEEVFADKIEQERRSEPREYTDILDAVTEMKQLLILGDPGAGKTTTLWHITAIATEKAMLNPEAPLPVLLRLGDLGKASGIHAQLQKQLGNLSLDTLLESQRLVLLVDGLNELPTENRDQRVQELRELFEQAKKQSITAAVTCRELDYTDKLDLKLSHKVNIKPLHALQIREFIEAYFRKIPEKADELFWSIVGGAEAQRWWTDFAENIGAKYQDVFWLAQTLPDGIEWGYSFQHKWRNWCGVRDDIRSLLHLASNPFMLYMIVKVFQSFHELPTNRGELFERFVMLLMKRERLTPDQAKILQNSLMLLAFDMQKQGEGTGFTVEQVRRYLPEGENLIYLALSTNILSGNDEIRFTHQLLQEYFAALRLQAEMETKPAIEIWSPENWWEPTGWEETAILLAGLYSDDPTPVLNWLKDANPELTARCVLESGASQPPSATLADLQSIWLPRLTDMKNDPNPLARASIGRGLGLLDIDNRSRVGVNTQDLPAIEWMPIPAGEFIYGDDNQEDYPDYAKPAPKQTIPLDAYYLSRYAVTYRQFQAFVEAEDGFRDKRWFDGLAADEGDRELREQGFKYWNHPRETVNWYQVMAYCRWLTWKLTGEPAEIPDLGNVPEWAVRLPTELEWEKGARGTKGLIYPYGDKFDALKGNTSPTGIRQTSAVGLFPDGASPYGLQDMSGNVWEWCLTDYNNPDLVLDEQNMRSKSPRVLRGGSWLLNQSYARCADRIDNSPNDRADSLGFRVCVSAPIFDTLDTSITDH